MLPCGFLADYVVLVVQRPSEDPDVQVHKRVSLVNLLDPSS